MRSSKKTVSLRGRLRHYQKHWLDPDWRPQLTNAIIAALVIGVGTLIYNGVSEILTDDPPATIREPAGDVPPPPPTSLPAPVVGPQPAPAPSAPPRAPEPSRPTPPPASDVKRVDPPTATATVADPPSQPTPAPPAKPPATLRVNVLDADFTNPFTGPYELVVRLAITNTGERDVFLTRVYPVIFRHSPVPEGDSPIRLEGLRLLTAFDGVPLEGKGAITPVNFRAALDMRQMYREGLPVEGVTRGQERIVGLGLRLEVLTGDNENMTATYPILYQRLNAEETIEGAYLNESMDILTKPDLPYSLEDVRRLFRRRQ